MAFAKRFNTVFHRLVFSYVILIVLTTFFMGSLSYVYYSNQLTDEVKKAHRLMLENMSGSFRKQVFDQMVKVHVALTANQRNQEHVLLFFRQPIKPHNAKIWDAYQYLQYLAASSEGLIASIDIYYRDNRMMISSSWGYQTVSDSERWEQMEWFDRIDFSDSNFYWTDQAPALITGSSGRSFITLVASYPYQKEANLGYVVIHADKQFAASLLQSSSSGNSGTLLILGPDSYYADRKLSVPEDVLGRLRTSGEQGMLTETIGGRSLMMTYHSLGYPSWKLVSMTPIDEFYRKSAAVQQMLMVIGLVSVGLGVLVSNVFTSRIYHPLRTLVERTRELFRDGAGGRKPGNEYVEINDLIDNLSVKVSRLEHTLQANQPLVKQSLVHSLLSGTIQSAKELGDYLQLLGITKSPAYCAAVHFRFNERMMGQLNLANGQFMLYHFIERLESENVKEMFCLAAKTSESGIGAVVFADSANTEALIAQVRYLQSYTYANFLFPVAASVGEWKQPPLAGESYREALRRMDNRFLFPAATVFDKDLPNKKAGNGEELDSGWLHAWMRALKGADSATVAKMCAEVKLQLRSGSYSADEARRIVQETFHAFKQYLYDVHLDREKVLSGELSAQAGRWEHIEEWEAWMKEAAERAFALIKERSAGRTLHVIDKVKEYIGAHLDLDLSLNAVADQVSLNPAYLSRMFKSSTGWNYVDYVTSERMNKARELLVATDEHIERIALSVGYYNPAYFTKKFKETFGMTPSELRMKQAETAVK